MPLENLGILQPWLVPKRKVGSSAGTLALNCIPEYKIHIKSIQFFALACFPAGRFSPIVCRFLMKTASWSSKSPKFSRCADFTKGATHPLLRGFPTHLRTHLPVGVRAPFRPRGTSLRDLFLAVCVVSRALAGGSSPPPAPHLVCWARPWSQGQQVPIYTGGSWAQLSK